MDNFLTWDYLLTFAGCLAATMVATQVFKNILKNVPAQLISYIFALAIIIVAQLATGKMEGWAMVALDVINAGVVSLSANGGYDALTGIFGKKEEKDIPAGDLTVMKQGEEKPELYLTLYELPENLQGKDTVTFKVHSTSSEG